MALKFYTSVTMELRVEKFWELITKFVEVTWEKLLEASPILKRV